MFAKINHEINPSKDQAYPGLAIKSQRMVRVLEYVGKMVKKIFSSKCAPGLHFFVDDQDD